MNDKTVNLMEQSSTIVLPQYYNLSFARTLPFPLSHKRGWGRFCFRKLEILYIKGVKTWFYRLGFPKDIKKVKYWIERVKIIFKLKAFKFNDSLFFWNEKINIHDIKAG